MQSSLTSCDKDDYGYVRVEVNAWAGIGSYIDSTSCNHPTDTIIKWWYDYQRPLPLDSLLNNMGNWGIDGADGNMNDSTSKEISFTMKVHVNGNMVLEKSVI